jgi:phosphoglycerol transferase MdoB-like AlkP superfamily enzyme
MEYIEPFAMGVSDRELYRQSMYDLKAFKEPFYAFYVTLSSHYPYGIPDEKRYIVTKPEDNNTLFGLYMQAINYADYAIGEFIEMLKEAGLYENSVIVIYGDHYGLTNSDDKISGQVQDLIGREYTIYDVFNVPLLIHIPGMERTETVSTAGGHLDVMPTLLPLLGIHNDKAVMFGQNLLEAEVGIVCQQTHLGIGSFISNEVYFSKAQNNIKGNYDAYAYGTMERLDPYLFTKISEQCIERISDCAALLQDNNILLD